MVTRPLQVSWPKRAAGNGSQGNHTGGGWGNAALSPDACDLEAIAADLRQAPDLLLADDADARRHPRGPDHHDGRRDRAVQTPARRRQAMGHRTVLCDPG